MSAFVGSLATMTLGNALPEASADAGCHGAAANRNHQVETVIGS